MEINAPWNGETDQDGADGQLARRYIAVATLANFRGRRNLEAHLFRAGARPEELAALEGKDLVGEAPPEIAGLAPEATEKMALEFLLEAFTKEEAQKMAEYLAGRYADQIASLSICPIELPVPLGLSPLSGCPEDDKAGFINFDLAKGYDLPFRFKGYYALN